MIEAAALLERATFTVIGSPTSPDLRLEVGLDGSTDGHVQATVRMKGDRVVFRFGPDQRVTNPARFAR
jgi:hypothetical protein